MKEINLTENPDVSVIVPVFNNARFIAPTLDSLVKQSYKNFEIIVVNDGSTDESDRVLQHFSFDRRLKVINQAHAGVGDALNTGHSAARGKYITYCAPGNVYYETFLQVMSVTIGITEKQNPPINFVYSDFEFLNPQGRAVQRISHNTTANTKQRLMMSYDIGFSLMYSRELWEQTGPYWGKGAEDYQWAIRAAQYGEFGLVCAVLSGQIIGSATPNDEEAIKECIELAAQLFAVEAESVG